MTTDETVLDGTGHDDDEQMYPFFVYGTLRPGEYNAVLWEGYAAEMFDGECTIRDHRLVTNGSFPYALPAAGQTTVGCLVVVGSYFYDELMDRLDRLEGVGHDFYRRDLAHVTIPGGGIVEAWLYTPCQPARHSVLRPVPDNDWSKAGMNINKATSGWTVTTDVRCIYVSHDESLDMLILDENGETIEDDLDGRSVPFDVWQAATEAVRAVKSCKK